MFEDCECELCGVPGTRSVYGVNLCDECDPNEEAEPEPPQWANEVPYGLLDSDADSLCAP